LKLLSHALSPLSFVTYYIYGNRYNGQNARRIKMNLFEFEFFANIDDNVIKEWIRSWFF